ncbi:MAG: ABC transporter permease [SAR324 cluster bacterium]|nr:ABC transporter permease [SAR324 cluster bacterium]
MDSRETPTKKIIVPFFVFILILVIWELADKVFNFPSIIFPAPSEIYKAFIENWSVLFTETGITLFESVCGFLLGSIIAYLFAIIFTFSPILETALYPYAIAIKSTPLIAIAPLLTLWFGNGLPSKIIMSALVAFFPVLVNSLQGLTSADRDLENLMKSLAANKWQILIKVRIPNSLGYLFSSLKIASSLAVVGAVIGEFVGASQGIGHLIKNTSYYLDTPLMFAGIAMISSGGILFFGLIVWLEKKLIYWD